MAIRPRTFTLVLCAVAAAMLALPLDAQATRRPRDRAKHLHVRSVTFEGNHSFSRYLLLDRMVTKPSRMFDRVPWSARALEDDIRVLQSFYQNQGYLDAQVRTAAVELDSLRHRVSVRIAVVEGGCTLVDSVSFVGCVLFTSTRLAAAARTKPGLPLRSPVMERDARNVLGMYTDRGWLAAAVRPQVRLHPDLKRATVVFSVVEGGISRAGSSRINGLKRVKPLLVERELQYKRGDTLTTRLLRSSVKGLRRTGLFALAAISPVMRDSVTGTPVAQEEKEVLVTVSEAHLLEAGVGVGYDTYEQLRASADITYRNLFGRGKRARLAGHASFVKQGAELGYTDPRFLALPVAFDLSGYFSHDAEPSWTANLGGVRASLSFSAPEQLTYRIRFRWEDVHYLDVYGVPPDSVEAKRTQSVGAGVAWDGRDDLFVPTRGTYAGLLGEVAGLGGRRSNQFARLVADARFHVPLGSILVLASSLRLGYMHEYGSSDSIPLTERFYAGGNASIRGFGANMVGPLVRDAHGHLAPRGGRVLVELHLLEARLPIYRMLYGAVFADAGNVYEWPSDVLSRDLRYSAGFGLHLRLPLGVVRAEVGFPLNRNPGNPHESPAWYHIDVGQFF
jgi:outer membrane protein insertion porin family